jgi:hypothetical protein
MRGNPGTVKIVTSTQPDSTPQPDLVLTNVVSGSLAIALPVVLICAIVGYQKHKAAVLRRRIQRLNRLWQLDSSEKLS